MSQPFGGAEYPDGRRRVVGRAFDAKALSYVCFRLAYGRSPGLPLGGGTFSSHYGPMVYCHPPNALRHQGSQLRDSPRISRGSLLATQSTPWRRLPDRSKHSNFQSTPHHPSHFIHAAKIRQISVSAITIYQLFSVNNSPLPHQFCDRRWAGKGKMY